jgi:hypothetical protein
VAKGISLTGQTSRSLRLLGHGKVRRFQTQRQSFGIYNVFSG